MVSTNSFSWCSRVLACVLVMCVATCGWTADNKEKIPEISPEKGRDYVGKKVTVIMAVKKAKFSEKRNTVFLDSEMDFKDTKNMAVILEADVLKKLKAAGNSAPHDHFRDKIIRATGTVELREDRPYLPVTAVADIEIKSETK